MILDYNAISGKSDEAFSCMFKAKSINEIFQIINNHLADAMDVNWVIYAIYRAK